MFRRDLRTLLAATACCVAACFLPLASAGQAAEKAIEPNGAAHAANGNEVYKALRGALPSSAGFALKDWTLEKEGASFHFLEGTFTPYGEVNGRVTGAVFIGKGHFVLEPKDVSEQHALADLTHQDSLSQDFDSMVLRFTDDTADQIRKASKGAATGSTQAGSMAAELAKNFRHDLHENLELRLLEDVIDGKQGGFFMASFRMGGLFTGRNVLFTVDPEGTEHSSPDEVELATWEGNHGLEVWTAYRLAQAGGEQRGVPIHVVGEDLDVTFEKSGSMKTSATTTFTAKNDGARVVRLDLYQTLRVSGVYGADGTPLDFVQEPKDNDPQFGLILPAGAKKAEPVRVLTKYAGNEALRRDGSGVYYLLPGARESWYPAGREDLGGYANYRMTFHLPKDLQIVATGRQVSLDPDAGGGKRAVWATDTPIPVAGFNLGAFKSAEAKTPAGFEVTAYANEQMPDQYAAISNAVMGGLTTSGALKDELAQGNAAIQIYTQYFGKLPYDHIALTQQSACDYGQSWPMLVYLPTCAFWDSTVKQQLGLLAHNRSYWDEVTPHEVSHQWWGQLVGFNNYRDQWMSEGFANYSAGLFLKMTSPKLDDYRNFWNEQRKNLLEKNANGKRPVDVGPVTMGYRVNNDKTGDFVAQMLIYSKGAYILHMLELMCWTPEYKDAPFQHSMQTFVKEYSGKAATTEDFKHSLEKSFPKWMNVANDGTLNWFFDEWVYGTEIPKYTVTSEFTVADGETTVHLKVAQTNVSNKFLMLVPIYLQMANGQTARIGNLRMLGDTTSEQTVKLGKLPSAGKKILVNYNGDILSE